MSQVFMPDMEPTGVGGLLDRTVKMYMSNFAKMLATIAVALFLAARIYSAGVLLYGQRVGLRQVLKAARVSR